MPKTARGFLSVPGSGKEEPSVSGQAGPRKALAALEIDVAAGHLHVQAAAGNVRNAFGSAQRLHLQLQAVVVAPELCLLLLQGDQVLPGLYEGAAADNGFQIQGHEQKRQKSRRLRRTR